MSTKYTVRQGDCIDSIAKRYGFFADTLWNDSGNRSLRDLRKDQNILLPGDVVTIPDLRQGEATGATEMKHRFRRKGVPARLRLRFFRPVAPDPAASSGGSKYDPSHYQHVPREPAREYEPIANAPFVLSVDGTLTDGQSDGEGMIDVPIQPNAMEGRIRFHPGTPEEIAYDLSLGEMAPIDTVIGVRKRLNNLSYHCMLSGDDLDESLRGALRRFQEEHNLTASGDIDQPTKNKLKDIHGS